MAAVSPPLVLKAITWAYDRAIAGLPNQPSAVELAEEYLRRHDNVDEAIAALIKWQTLKCGTAGFVAGLGGLVTLPVALPADLAITYFITIRMVAAIAYMRNYDLHSDQTRTMVLLALVGDSAKDVLYKAGVKIGSRIGENMLAKVPALVLKKVQQAIGVRLAAKAGKTSALSLARLAPIFGGIAGGTVNVLACRAIGEAAKTMLPARDKG